MNWTKIFMLALVLCGVQAVNAQTEEELITETLMDYIDGTANGDQERVANAFHEDLNLYSTKEDGSLKVWPGKDYLKIVRKSNRIGKIVSLDYEKDAAMAKIEIDMPGAKKIFTDYLILLKVEGHWKIIHKIYTFRRY